MGSLPLPSITIFVVISFIFNFSSIPVANSVPFVVIHGLSERCDSHRLERFIKSLSSWSGAEGLCMEIGDGAFDSWTMPLMEQTEVACEKVKAMSELSDGYSIVGLSQGNLIARGVIELCDGGPPVKNFISLAGPHAGIAAPPYCERFSLCVPLDILIEGGMYRRFPPVANSILLRSPHSGLAAISDCKCFSLCAPMDMLIKRGMYNSFLQDSLAPSNYFKIPLAIPNYLDGCKFLPKLNNEIADERNSTYKKRFASLDNLVLIMFEKDAVLVPKETSWFGFYPDGAFAPVLPPQKTKLYMEDWIGLKALDEAGKVKFISLPGGHLNITKRVAKKFIAPYLEDVVAKTPAPVAKSSSYGWLFQIPNGILHMFGLLQVKPSGSTEIE